MNKLKYLQSHPVERAPIYFPSSELKRYPRAPSGVQELYPSSLSPLSIIQHHINANLIMSPRVALVVFVIIYQKCEYYCGAKMPDPSQATIPPVTSLPRYDCEEKCQFSETNNWQQNVSRLDLNVTLEERTQLSHQTKVDQISIINFQIFWAILQLRGPLQPPLQDPEW